MKVRMHRFYGVANYLFCVCGLVFSLFAFGTISARAQASSSTAELSGQVTDVNGAAVPGAERRRERPDEAGVRPASRACARGAG